MRATCPSCEAVYEIPDRLAGPGRRLRCANCGQEWTLGQAASVPPAASAGQEGVAAVPAPASAAPPPPPPAYTAAARPEPEPMSYAASASAQARPMLRRAPQVIDPPLPPVDDGAGFRYRGGPALKVAWAVSVLALVLALGALWTFRYQIADAWPPASRLTGRPVGGG